MIKWLILLLLPFSLFADKFLNLEVAKTDEEKTFGLMNRHHLDTDSGMLFVYDKERPLSFWMFNCYIDLSIAFIDSQGLIVDIKNMKSFGQIMDKSRPVNTLNDFHLYPEEDPVINFFKMTATRSKKFAKYAIETNAGWFEKNNIKIGDKVLIEGKQAIFKQ
jgi:uncharacterized membrane protein (UPF0127 family)